MVTIRDNVTKTVREVVKDETDRPGMKVRPMFDAHEPIALADQPDALAEITGRTIAGLRELSRNGARLESEELEMVANLAKTVGTLITAAKKMQETKPEEMTEAQLRALAGG